MKNYTATREIEIDGMTFPVSVLYTITPGRPQTYGQPSEYPDPNIKAISIEVEPGGWRDAKALHDVLAEAIPDDWLVDEAARQDVEGRDAAADQADHLRRECA